MENNYHLLIGKVKDMKMDTVGVPHIELLIEARNELYRASINLESKKHPHRLLYKKVENFKSPLLNKLKSFNHGLIEISDDNSELAVEYDTGDFVIEKRMKKVPYKKAGPNNDLVEFLFPLFNKTIDNPFVTIYLYGEFWGPKREHDQYFGFSPSQGIHNIHKMQGDFRLSEDYAMDGCVFIRNLDNWTAIFLAFQE